MKCKCGGIIKRIQILGVMNSKFDPFFRECQKCFKMWNDKMEEK